MEVLLLGWQPACYPHTRRPRDQGPCSYRGPCRHTASSPQRSDQWSRAFASPGHISHKPPPTSPAPASEGVSWGDRGSRDQPAGNEADRSLADLGQKKTHFFCFLSIFATCFGLLLAYLILKWIGWKACNRKNGATMT